MKKLIPVFALLILCLYSCKKEPKKTFTQPKDVPLSERPIPTLPNSNNVATGVAGGAHYICPNNCEGGTSGAQGTCPVCSSALAHNQGFHNMPSSPNTLLPSATTPTPTPTSGPNLAGQYHYTCSNGCSGGGDATGKCDNCAGDLAHNAAFHN
jgi:hypothetical protein